MSRVIIRKSSPKPRVIVKAEVAMTSSGPMIMYGGGGGAPAQRTRASKFLGGVGTALGAGLGALGPHRSLGSLAQGMQSGAMQGSQFGNWLGRGTKLLPGAKTRMAGVAQKEKEREEYHSELASRKQPRYNPESGEWEKWNEGSRVGQYMPTGDITGKKGIFRQGRQHALNQWAMEAAKQKQAMEDAKAEHAHHRNIKFREQTDPKFATTQQAQDWAQQGIQPSQIGPVLSRAAELGRQIGGDPLRAMTPFSQQQSGWRPQVPLMPLAPRDPAIPASEAVPNIGDMTDHGGEYGAAYNVIPEEDLNLPPNAPVMTPAGLPERPPGLMNPPEYSQP